MKISYLGLAALLTGCGYTANHSDDKGHFENKESSHLQNYANSQQVYGRRESIGTHIQ